MTLLYEKTRKEQGFAERIKARPAFAKIYTAPVVTA